MINQDSNNTEKLKNLLSGIFYIYKQLEIELLSTKNDQSKVHKLIQDLDFTFDEIIDLDLYNQDTSWLQNTIGNARKNRQEKNISEGWMSELADRMWDEMEDEKLKNVKYENFYKENGMWYISLPEFVNMGLGNKNNLLMVDGSDTFLDILSGYEPNTSPNGTNICLVLCDKEFLGCTHRLTKLNNGLNQDLLNKVGHAPVDYGAYYKVEELEHKLWLCPVTEYVFNGVYPEEIFLRKND